MKVMMVAIILAFSVGSCAQNSVPASDVKSPKEQPTVQSKSTETSKINECKICDFDFDSYKGELNKGEIEGLLLALNDEYLATEIYKGVNKKFDSPRPFVNIVKAEMRHAGKLVELFKKYGLSVPDNKWEGEAPQYESVVEACKAGIEAEIVNAELYDRLFKSTTREDILLVYKNLKRASDENHKPAFERCASGKGRGRRAS